ncbi:MAG: ABC transporter ATP-binding protein [Thaumarchaeota archaeon]|nr:ABC transporter ATP-binding protein [Nitrososphaerota archaeon]
MEDHHILNVHELKTYFYTENGIVKAVDGISFQLGEREIVGLVGESGSGKTVTALSVLRLVPRPGRIVSGKVYLEGEDLLAKSEKEMARVRGRKVAIVFQDPSSSLDPLFTVGDQVQEIIMYHEGMPKKEAVERTTELFQRVGIPEPEKRIHMYPHEFSGGMRQRICIARALALSPKILFADEPTTNLDVTIQAQVLDLMRGLHNNLGMSMVIITHDMGIVADMAQRIVVLYAGNVCEAANTHDLFYSPKHPYTEALLEAVPRLDRHKKLGVIKGNIPNLIEPPSGCRFHPRCPYAKEICSQKVPELEKIDGNHYVACHRWRELALVGGA